MRGTGLATAVLAASALACSGDRMDPLPAEAVSGAGIRMGALKVVPPSPGRVVGEVEIPFRNESDAPVPADRIGDGEPLGREDSPRVGRGFETIPLPGPRGDLGPGEERRIRCLVVRVTAEADSPLQIRGRLVVREGGRTVHRIATGPAALDPAEWPVAEALPPAGIGGPAGVRFHCVLSGFYEGLRTLHVSPQGAASGHMQFGHHRKEDRLGFFEGRLSEARWRGILATLRALPPEGAGITESEGPPRFHPVSYQVLVEDGPRVMLLRATSNDRGAEVLRPLRDQVLEALRELSKQ